MTPINRDSPEWEAIREYAAARVNELSIALCKRQSHEDSEEKRTRIEELTALVEHFEPAESQIFEPEMNFGM